MVLLLKLCAIPLYPLGCSITLMVIGLILYFVKKKWWVPFIIAGVSMLYIASTPLVSRIFLKALENRWVVQSPLPNDCSAIVVLGGGGTAFAPPMIYPEVNDAGDRILHAARLFRRGYAPRIITTGGFIVGSRVQTIPEGEQNALLLEELGIDAASIFKEKKARTTAEHPRLVGKILDSLNLSKKIILVTSATHMYRSVGVFRKAGFEVYPAATDFRGIGRLVENVNDFFPVASALDNLTTAVHEMYGVVGYRVMGKM